MPAFPFRDDRFRPGTAAPGRRESALPARPDLPDPTGLRARFDGHGSADAANAPAVTTGWPAIGPLKDAQFDWMRVAFSPRGGLLHSEECQRRLRQQTDQPVSRLARAIVSRALLSLSWDGDTWIPAFQFAEDGLSVRPCCAQVFEELGPLFDDWELAWWFAVPNAWLGGAAPVDRLDDPALLLHAARADRFIARG
jgi:hypothetical protein